MFSKIFHKHFVSTTDVVCAKETRENKETALSRKIFE